MKRKQVLLFGIVMTSILCMVLLISSRKSKNDELYGKELFEGHLSQAEILTLEGTRFDYNLLSKDKATLLVLFDSECPGCIMEMDLIKRNIQKLNRYNIIFVSGEELEKIKFVLKEKGLLDFDNIYAAKTDINYIFNKIAHLSYPSVIIYDKQGSYVKGFKGGVNLEDVLKLIN
jgi:thiol-disulfide isomerase/thioredoxin